MKSDLGQNELYTKNVEKCENWAEAEPMWVAGSNILTLNKSRWRKTEFQL